MSELSKVCYAIRAVNSVMSQEILRIIYFSYVHFIMTYGVFLGGISSCSSTIFKIQKRIVRVITNSCRGLFKKLNILPLQSQYIFSLLLFVINNRDLSKSNIEIHVINMRHGTDLHPPTSSLTTFQK
jgi:hypothetical protein